jgi:hypothetical protein
MAKAAITLTGATAGEFVFARIYPDGVPVYDGNGNPFIKVVTTNADANGNWTLNLEQTDLMAPGGMAWEITEASGVPYYIQFGVSGGVASSLKVSKPASVLDPVVRRLIPGAGLTTVQDGESAQFNVTNSTALANLASGSGASVKVDKVHISGATGHAAGGGGAWVVPAGGAIVLPISCGLNVTVVATGTCLLDIGYTAVSAATLSDTLFDGRDGHTATAFFTEVALSTNALVRAGNESPIAFLAAAGKWITISAQDSSSDLTGLVADLYIAYFAL